MATDRRPDSPHPAPSPQRIPSTPPLHLLHRGTAPLEYPQRTPHNTSIAPVRHRSLWTARPSVERDAQAQPLSFATEPNTAQCTNLQEYVASAELTHSPTADDEPKPVKHHPRRGPPPRKSQDSHLGSFDDRPTDGSAGHT